MQQKINWGTKYHCEKSLNLFQKLKKRVGINNNLLLNLIKTVRISKKKE